MTIRYLLDTNNVSAPVSRAPNREVVKHLRSKAAIAFVNELTLVTMNSKDFKAFAGVEVEDWSRRRV